MERNTTLSAYFFKKNISSVLSFGIILSIATILFTASVVVHRNIKGSYDRKFAELNTANAFFTIPVLYYSDDIISDIQNIPFVQDVEVRNGIYSRAKIEVDGKNQDENLLFYNLADYREMNKYETVAGTPPSTIGTNSLYLTNYTYIHSGKNIGETFEFSIGEEKYSYAIAGVLEEMQYGYHSGPISEYLTADAYERFRENNIAREVATISVKSDESEKVYDNIAKYLSAKAIPILYKDYDIQLKYVCFGVVDIIILILVVFSTILIAISLLVSKFKIGQSIDEEIANMGVLKAIGYTSKDIITAIVIPYILCGLLSTLVGIVLSPIVAHLLGTTVEIQSGFIWQVCTDLKVYVFVAGMNFGLIAIFSLQAAAKIRKLNPINAIRGLDEAKKTKNRIEIERTKGNIEILLILKNFLNTLNQNILLGTVLFFITLISGFVATLFYNVNVKPQNFVDTLVEEHPSVVLTFEENIEEELQNFENVRKVITYEAVQNVIFADKSYDIFVTPNFELIENDLCYEGRNPFFSDEVAIGSSLQEQYDIHLNDIIEMSKNGKSYRYKVTGFIQSVNYKGKAIEMTTDGYKNLVEDYVPKTFYVYLEDETKSSAFIAQVEDMYKDKIVSTVDYVESMESASISLISMISIISIVIIAITVLLIYLILYILISSIITRTRRELGIYKAIGYRNIQLMRQLVGGFMPSALISTAIGLAVSKLFMNSMYLTVFKSLGIYKINFDYPLLMFFATSIIIVLSTALIGIIISRKIKNISVYALIRE